MKLLNVMIYLQEVVLKEVIILWKLIHIGDVEIKDLLIGDGNIKLCYQLMKIKIMVKINMKFNYGIGILFQEMI